MPMATPQDFPKASAETALSSRQWAYEAEASMTNFFQRILAVSVLTWLKFKIQHRVKYINAY